MCSDVERTEGNAVSSSSTGRWLKRARKWISDAIGRFSRRRSTVELLQHKTEAVLVEESMCLDEEDGIVISGSGDVEGVNKEVPKDWKEVLERWDGRDRVRPSKVVKLCRKGIPGHMRSQVWQILTGAAHDPQLAEVYGLLLVKESPDEDLIQLDVKRTGHKYFQNEDNRTALYNIIKAYSIYDEEVGYIQGFSFMAAVLMLQKMPEETAFSLLVKIMYKYGHRNLFKANFQDLHMMFFQLEKLMEENLPDLFKHMTTNGMETHMFATQWFLTLYSVKFPPSVVVRLLDVYLCEGIGVIFQVALALLKIAKRDLLTLDFEGIFNYLSVSLPNQFHQEEDCQHLFHLMANFKVSEKKLAELEREYRQHLEEQALLDDPVVMLRSETDKLEERIDKLSKECRSNEAAKDEALAVVHDWKEELKQAKEEFERLLIKLTEEQQQHAKIIEDYKQMFHYLDKDNQKRTENLNRELLEVKGQLGSTAALDSVVKLRNLEMELGQTKLALVEFQCKNQEVQHKLVKLHCSKSRY